jgi:4-amino-4-deoxy-L-arabinose transferase-like glycosyltransferase
MRLLPSLILVLLVALALRLSVTAWRGFDRKPEKDEWSYSEIAGHVAAGEGIWFEVTREVGGEPVTRRLFSLRPPLYPVILGGLYAATGKNVAAGRALSALLGALAVGAFFLWAESLYGRRRALLLALAFAAWPAHLWVSGELLTEPLFMLLVVGSLGALGRGRTLLAGVLLGLAVLTRPSGLLLLLPAGLFVLSAPRRIRGLALLVVPVVLLLAPWVARNTAIHGRPLLTTNMGVTFLGGNSERSLSASPPGRWHLPEDVLEGDPPPMGYYGWPELTERENDRRFLALGLEWVKEHPGRWLRLVLRKGVRFFDPDQHSSKPDHRVKAVAGWVTFGPLLLLALLGLAKARRRELLLPLGLIAVQLATALVFYGDARVRLPAIPGFLLVAMAGIEWFVRRRGSGGASRGSAEA